MNETRESVNPAAEKLFREQGNALFSYCLSILLSPAAAEDAVQEALLRLISNGTDPERDPAPLLFTIARNICLNERKRLSLKKTTAIPHYLASPGDPHTSTVKARISARVRVEIGRLPVRQREVTILTYEGGFTLKEAARIIGVSPGAAASHKARAMNTLKKRLEKDYKEWMRDESQASH